MYVNHMPLNAQRCLHIIDIENLTGFPSPAPAEVRSTYQAYRPRIGPTDLVVVASSHHAAPSVWWEWPTDRFLLRSGPNGADDALIDVLRNESVGTRFDRVSIGSGDGAFAQPAAELAAEGVWVTVVAGRGSVSRRLRMAARSVDHLAIAPAHALQTSA